MQSDFKSIATIDSKGTQSVVRPLKSNVVCTCVAAFQIQQQSNKQFACSSCQLNLQRVNAVKKNMILVQYENAKLTQQLKQLTNQCENLKRKVNQNMEQKIKLYGESKLYLNIKEDLEAQLFQSKYINKMLMMNQLPKQSIQFRQKIQKALIQNLVLQQQLQQRNKIIKDTVLYPIYHYDSRIKNLRQAVSYFYRMANKQYKKAQQMMKMMKKQIQQFKYNAKHEIQNAIHKYINDNKQNIAHTNYKYGTLQTHEISTHYKTNKAEYKTESIKNQFVEINKQKAKVKSNKSKSKKVQKKACKQLQLFDTKTKQQKNMRICCLNKNSINTN